MSKTRPLLGQTRYDIGADGYCKWYIYRAHYWRLKGIIAPSAIDSHREDMAYSAAIAYLVELSPILVPTVQKEKKSRPLNRHSAYRRWELLLIDQAAESIISYDQLKSVLPHRSRSSLYNKIRQAKKAKGIRLERRIYTKWTAEELETLRRLYVDEGYKPREIVDIMETRAETSIRLQIKSFGLKEARKKKYTGKGTRSLKLLALRKRKVASYEY